MPSSAQTSSFTVMVDSHPPLWHGLVAGASATMISRCVGQTCASGPPVSLRWCTLWCCSPPTTCGYAWIDQEPTATVSAPTAHTHSTPPALVQVLHLPSYPASTHSTVSCLLCCRFFTYPTDSVKARLQLQGTAGSAVLYSSTLDAVRKIAAREGLPGFYRGFW